MFELTGALSHVLPIMISVVVSKWVGDALGKEGIYSVWIAMRSYPWLPPTDYRDNGQTAASIMKSADNLTVIHDGGRDALSVSGDLATIKDLREFVEQINFHGLPVVTGAYALVGFVVRDKLKAHLGPSFPTTASCCFVCCLADSRGSADTMLAESAEIATRRWTFVSTVANSRPELVNLSPLLEGAVLQLRKEVPLQLVVNMFQKMVTRSFPTPLWLFFFLTFFPSCSHKRNTEFKTRAILSGRKTDRSRHQDGRGVVVDGSLASHGCIVRESSIVAL